MTKRLLVIFLFIFGLHTAGYGQSNCAGFSITGSTTSPYFMSMGAACTVSPISTGTIYWTSALTTTGFLRYSFSSPQTDVSVWYTILNTDDFGTITVNGGGTLTLSVTSGCANVTGNVLGPYTGVGMYGDVLVNLKSTAPFTEITLVNTGAQSGICSGDCNSVVINTNNPCYVYLGKDTTLCEGQNLLLDATRPNATYVWQDNSTNATFNVTQPGTYWVKVTVNSCTKSDTINVNYNPLPVVDLGANQFLCLGETLKLDASTPNATYLWQDNSTNASFTVAQEGTYWSEVTVNRCRARDSVLITGRDCEVIILVPNLFTPNNDGLNDVFAPIMNKGIVAMNTIICNRWGSKIVESDKLAIEWDGHDVSDGVYFWAIRYTDVKGVENTMNGYVLLLR